MLGLPQIGTYFEAIVSLDIEEKVQMKILDLCDEVLELENLLVPPSHTYCEWNERVSDDGAE